MLDLKTLPILIVDDDAVDIELVLRTFKKRGITNPVVCSHDGVDALKILTGKHAKTISQPCLILLDINMPRMNGIELLRHLHQDEALKRNIVYIVTTSPRDEDLKAAREYGAAEYFVKDNLAAIANRLTSQAA